MQFLGDLRINDYITFGSQLHRFSSGAVYAPTGNVTYTFYENNSTTGAPTGGNLAQLNSKTGLYTARVQLTTASGFEAGKEYLIHIEATVDGVTAGELLMFRIISNPAVDVDTIKTQTVTCAAGVTVNVNLGTTQPINFTGTGATAYSKTDVIDVAGTAQTAGDIGSKTGFSLSSTGADLILKTSTFAQAIAAAINELATYGLTALNTLLVTTGIKASTIPNATVGGYAAGQDPVTLINAGVPDVNVKTETNHDFTALQKTSLNAATPAASIGVGGIQSTSFAANAIDAAALATDAGTEIANAIKAAVIEAQGSYTIQQALSIILAVLAGVTSSGGATLKTPNGSATRVSSTINGSNERTAMTLTPSA